MRRGGLLGRGLPIVDYSVCCALGANRAQVQAKLFEGGSGLMAPPFALPYPAPCGLVPVALPELPVARGAYDTRQARLALLALAPLRESIARSVERHGATRVGIVLGSSNAGLDTTERRHRKYLSDGRAAGSTFLPAQHAFSAVLDLLRLETGIAGPAHFVSTACSSAGKAFGSAARLVEAGVVDAVLVGGVDALCEMTVRGFRSLGVLAETPCRPFGAERPGINIGEGAALFVLDRAGDAPCALLGVGESADAHHMTAPDPEGTGAEQAMRGALALAQLTPSDIDLINAHATGTATGDVAEALAIDRIFGRSVPVSATKGYTGHALGAAGAIEAALAMLCLDHSWLPASLGALPLDPSLHIDVVTGGRTAKIRRFLSNSCAFGGSNVSVIMGRAP